SARWIFHSAGVETAWSLCHVAADSEERCVLPPSGEYFQAIVRRNGMGLKRTDEGMGLALIVKGERRVVCYAFLERAEALAHSTHGSLAVVLASILAHEVGHLMGLKHSVNGIMKPKFERNDIVEAESGRLLFDSGDTKALRNSHR